MTRFLRLLLGAAVLLGTAPHATSSPQTSSASDEVMYVLTGGGQWLIAYDSVTLKRGQLNGCGTKLRWQATLMGLAYGNDRLYSIDMNAEYLPDRFVEVHPANGDSLFVGYPGMSQTTNWAIDFNKADNRIYAIESYYNLVEVDPSTGTATHLATLNGPAVGAGVVAFSMAINSAGVAVISGFPVLGPTFGYLDLTSGAVTPIGRLEVGIGVFWDLAFDSNDQLWGIFRDYLEPQRDGLYRIQLSPLKCEKVADDPALGISWQSLAFGPAPKVRNYCTPTPSATGCAPLIEFKGLPTSKVPSGFEVRALGAPSGALGFLVWGGGPKASLPFGGGLLCIGGILTRSVPVDSGGNMPPGADCTGTWSTDLNALLYRQGVYAPGTVVRCQWIGVDSSTRAVPRNSVMSNALELMLVP